MVFKETEFILKDGRKALLRSPCEEDAEEMLQFITKASGETDYLMRYPEEYADFTRKNADEAMARIIQSGIDMDTIDAIIAFNDEMAIGAHEAMNRLLPDREHPYVVGVDALSCEN